MLRQTAKTLFNPQHRTPILPQVPVVYAPNPKLNIRVAYLLSRHPTVKPEPHPLESEFAFTLQREHSRYARHDSDSLTQFMAAREQSMDSWGRSDPSQLTSNFFGLEMYQDSMKTVLNRYKPLPRLTPSDFVDLKAEQRHEPPQRHTIQRHLADYLFLIIKDSVSGKWTVPSVQRKPHESLRMTLDRAIDDHHKGALDTYAFSNAPQGLIRVGGDDVEKANSNKTEPNEGEQNGVETRTFIYNVAYLSGRPNFVELGCSDHAWVTRCELAHYAAHYAHPSMYAVLRDIAPDAMFDRE